MSEENEEEKKKRIKAEIIKNITAALELEGRKIEADEHSTLKDRCLKMDVVLDTLRFLKDYEENVAILNSFGRDRRFDNKRSDDEGR